MYHDNKSTQVDNDDTLDDYPGISDLGDGRILITWSSADRVLNDGATVEEAAKAMNIKARFFNKSTAQFDGEAMQVTKTTEEDYSADTMANAAYDADTGRLILYYTKTEYDGLEDVGDLTSDKKVFSANAYMFYENGRWSNADDYTDEELEGQTDKEKYKENWYGQRFLDVRINKNPKLTPKVTDTTSISFNGLALYAWMLDWDGDLDTMNDRDVFMQIYNFSQNSFTHIIRVTPESAAYTTPKFARSDNATYLFFGETKTASGSGTETELAEHGAIKYLDVGDLIANDKFTKITDGSTAYYIFQYDRETYVFDESSDKTSETPAERVETETVIAKAGIAAECDNPMEYDVKVSGDGQMYLFWTDAVDGARQIMTAMYNGSDENDDDESKDENVAGADLTDKYWSEPVQLTSAEKGEYYSGIGATVTGDKIVTLSAKGSYAENKVSLVNNVHTPFAGVKAESVELTDEMPMPLSTVTLRAAVKNEGLLKADASEDKPIPVTFTVNGENPVTANITKPIPGGSKAYVTCSVTLPEDISDTEFAAFTNGNDKVTAKLMQQSDIKLTDNRIERIASDGYNAEKVVYSAVLRNDGNADGSGLSLRAAAGDTVIGSADVVSLGANEAQIIEMELNIPDSAYEIGSDGVGSANISIDVLANGETVTSYSGMVQKTFSAEAINALAKVTDVKFANNGSYSMKETEKQDIQPTIEGDDENSLMVMWLESSNSDVAYINYDNMVVAGSRGAAEITGIVVPAEEKVDFTSGTAKKTDWKELIPSDKLITVKATVNVTGSGGGNSGSGSGGGLSKRQYTLTLDFANGGETETIKVNKDGTVSNLPTPLREGYKFEGWYTDEALTIPFIIACDDTNVPIGFMGAENGRLEMLFLAPTACGKGIGRQMVHYGIAHFGIREVTVNEQNPQAVGFYQHLGFETYQRTELDEEGNPYPLLYMKLTRQ